MANEPTTNPVVTDPVNVTPPGTETAPAPPPPPTQNPTKSNKSSLGQQIGGALDSGSDSIDNFIAELSTPVPKFDPVKEGLIPPPSTDDAADVTGGDAGCLKKREKEAKEKTPNDIQALTIRVNRIAKQIRFLSDCDTIKMAIKHYMDVLEEAIKRALYKAKKKAEAAGLMKLPTPTPWGIVKWLGKLVFHDIWPAIVAAVKYTITIVKLVAAVVNLVKAIQTAIPKIKQCIKSLDNWIKDEIKGRLKGYIKGELNKIKQKIAKKIAKAICGELQKSGLTVEDIEDASKGLGAVITAIDKVQEYKAKSADATETGLAKVESAQGLMTNISGGGVPAAFDTSSPEALEASVNSGAFDTMQSAVTDHINAPPLVSSANAEVRDQNGLLGQPLKRGTEAQANTGAFEGALANTTYTYQWYRDNVPITGANSSTYVLGSEDVGKRVTVTVGAFNQSSYDEHTSAPSEVVVEDPAAVTVNPVITGNSTVGSTLSCNSGTWANVTPDYYHYQWQWAHINADINEANSSTYTIIDEDLGQRLRCKVTAVSVQYGNAFVYSGATDRVTGNVSVVGTLSVTGTLNVTGNTNVAAINATSLSATNVTATGNVSGNYVLASNDVFANTGGTTIKLVRHYHANNRTTDPFGYPTSN